LTPGLSTGLGRFGGGGVGAAVVEAASMGLLEERSHSGLEKTVRIGRAFVLGGTSAAIGGAVGAAVAGAVAGSFVPVVGTVVGLLAGAATYYFLDKLTPGGRADWDGKEAGCQPKAAAPSSVDAEEIESTEGY
jgi:MFS family permease